MKNKKGIAFYIFFLLIAVGFVAVGLLLPPRQPRMTQDDTEKPPAAMLRVQGGQDEAG